ncbi:uncharacterized protein [Euwallacea similis]|uniref:uncharacterized protein n=1 Tax=Euwallacea similis TaxID=1736056 RepID=UPI00344D8DE3
MEGHELAYSKKCKRVVFVNNLVFVMEKLTKTHTFKTNKEFCTWLISKKHAGYTAIAHNTKAYDSQLILQFCVENSLKPYTIYNETKIMMLEVGPKIKIINSHNFVVSALSDFPKTFALTEWKKGYFPHFFNVKKNQNYIGSIPDAKCYGPNTMKKETRKKFLEWHTDRVKENYVFDFQKELVEYCNSDVDILRRGCLELRKQFLEIANIDLFQYITIAAACMAIYRSNYLQENMLGPLLSVDLALSRSRYTRHSDALSLYHRLDLHVFSGEVWNHALNGGEVIICGAKVDGFNETTNTVYHYHGCFWHGCTKCYQEDTVNTVNKETMGDFYKKTKERNKQITDASYKLVQMWECKWIKSKDYKNTLNETLHMVELLNPRDAFYGGRTNACKLKIKAKMLRYIDVCSLYPSVQYFDYYPVAHSIKIFKPKSFEKCWYGFIKCQILPPRKLYHPVLSIKEEKLIFTLCSQFFKEKCEKCCHSEDERSLIGTWTTDEVNKPIEKDFIKIKLETSSWKDNYKFVEDYISAAKKHLDLDLVKENIIPNPGKRAVEKICLNSLWGKLGQRQNASKRKYIIDAKLIYKYKNMFVENSLTTNVAAFTTSNVRLRLYDMLDQLGEAVVYYDIDSIIYIDDGTNTVKTGCMLGSKSYAYDTKLKKGVMKIKGFTLNYENSQKLNHKTMEQILDKEIDKIKRNYNMITKDVKNKRLVNKNITKEFTFDYDKRMILNEEDGIIDTLPWGYC